MGYLIFQTNRPTVGHTMAEFQLCEPWGYPTRDMSIHKGNKSVEEPKVLVKA